LALFSETFSSECASNISFLSYGVIGNARRLAKAGRLDVIPSNYSAFCADFAAGHHRADLVLVQLAQASDNRLSASLSNDYVIAAARRARLVIAEINPHAPWTHGAEWPDDVPIHLRVAAHRPPVELPSTVLDDVSRRIAAHAAGLIADGSTLQFGVGRIPDAILSSLSHARDLGIHSGLINDAVIDLIERGAVTNARKGLDAGITVTNQVIGTQRLYRFVHEDRAIAVRPASYTHNQGVLARVNRLVAMNSALQVGLDGSVNAETLNGAAVGALGGQLDFVRGANGSPGGRAIIALPATASDGTSRIVPDVETVTTPRADVDVIVTEFGVAELRRCNLAERARRLIAIAAPQHRAALSAELKQRGR
jgi:acyl-CoA hydrolase